MYRGCMSDTKIKGQELCTTNNKNCYKCNGNQCNYLQSFEVNHRITSYLNLTNPNFGGNGSAQLTSFCALATLMAALIIQWI